MGWAHNVQGRKIFSPPSFFTLNEIAKNGSFVQWDAFYGVEKREKDASVKEKRNRYEVDFIATQGSKKYYVQSAFALPSSEKEQQEKFSLQNIGDNFKKIIVVKDVIKPQRDNDGITTMGLFDFLLNESSLEL